MRWRERLSFRLTGNALARTFIASPPDLKPNQIVGLTWMMPATPLRAKVPPNCIVGKQEQRGGERERPGKRKRGKISACWRGPTHTDKSAHRWAGAGNTRDVEARNGGSEDALLDPAEALIWFVVWP